MRNLLGCGLLLAIVLLPLGAFAQQNSGPLTNDDIVSMVKAGLAPEVVIAKIKSSRCQFDTSPVALETLKNKGVPEQVILTMVQATATTRNHMGEISQQPTVNTILDNYVLALGGEQAIRKTTTIVIKGTVLFKGKPGTYESYFKAPNKTLFQEQLSENAAWRLSEGFDGSVGWQDSPQTGVRMETGQQLAIVARSAQFYGVLKLRDLYAKMTLLGEQTVGNHACYVVEADAGDGSLSRLYFDQKTGLLTRGDLEYDSPQGRRVSTWYYDDYRDVDGRKFAFVKRQSDPTGEISYTATDIRLNVPIADSIFAKPAAKAAAVLQEGTLRAIAWRGVPWATTSYYQQPGSGYADCMGQGQWLGSIYQSNLSCTGSYTPAQNIPLTWQHYTIYNLVETSSAYLVLACTRNWRWSKCSYLVPGNVFSFEYKKGQIWVSGERGGKGKEETLKYAIVVNRPKTNP